MICTCTFSVYRYIMKVSFWCRNMNVNMPIGMFYKFLHIEQKVNLLLQIYAKENIHLHMLTSYTLTHSRHHSTATYKNSVSVVYVKFIKFLNPWLLLLVLLVLQIFASSL